MKVKHTLIISCFSLFTFHFSLISAQQGTWFWGSNCVGNDAGVESIASDTKGNCYMAGLFVNDTIHFGSYTLMNSTVNFPPDNSSDIDALLVKYDHNGNVLWAKQTFEKNSNPSLQNDAPESVATDDWGNAYLCGNFIDTIFIGTYTLITNSQLGNIDRTQNIYLAKYDQNGNVVWGSQATCVNDSGFINEDGISCDNKGNIYVTGLFVDTIRFVGSNTISTPTATANMFLVKYDSSGNVKWAKQAIGIKQGGAQGYGVTNDRNGNTFVTGDFNDSTIFGTYKIGTKSSADFFIAKYDPNGNVLWAKQATVPSNSSNGLGLASVSDQTGNVYIAGNFTDTLIFNQDTIIAPNNLFQSGFFLVKYDLNGNLLWVKQSINKDNNDWNVGGLAIDNSKHLYLSAGGGQGANEIIFAGDTLSMNDTSKYDGASVIFKLDSNGNAICSSIIPIGTSGGDYPYVASDTSGNYVYLGSSAQGIDVFGNDTVNPFTFYTGYPLIISCPFVARWQECDSNVLYASVNEVKVESEKVKVYPNPNNGTFTLAMQNVNEPAQVEIYNMLGESICKKTLNPTNTTINLAGQPAGVYFYRVVTETGNLVGSGKVVVQK